MTNKFFEESKEQSRIKGEIVTKYFNAWSQIIKRTASKYGGKIGYADLFAGPGQYDDGTVSTPVLVVETVLRDPELSKMFVSIFNDGNPDHAASLEAVISSIPGIEHLQYKPKITNNELDGSSTIELQELENIPSLFFIDPWGYKGLSLNLIETVVRDWGSEAIIFFNYNRVNPGVPNDSVRLHMNALFTGEEVDRLRIKLQSLDSNQREVEILNVFCKKLEKTGRIKYVLPFRFFKNNNATRTSHYLIFVSKHIKGYSAMKEIMAKASSNMDQGVASFSYVPASPQQDFLYGFMRPLDDLKEDLLTVFAGKILTTKEIYEKHSIGTNFILANYKTILREMYLKEEITAAAPNGKPIRNGFPDGVMVTFPERS